MGELVASAEQRVRELGLPIPDYANPPYGQRYGRLKPFHRIGNLLELSGLTPRTGPANGCIPEWSGATSAWKRATRRPG
ncbi:hypothetical protein Jiend_54830 [Micromonospora endophytica]|uniref:hypothetical protein n=1 Tax=Micromonospora endophytica TaxID=515350 RepID=UPI001BB446B9|nr:hypothetical protein [Micromonospora endophytica]BCJ62061.1 hypothetical protein Jiend_54830 [Micromonospora endophytica]